MLSGERAAAVSSQVGLRPLLSRHYLVQGLADLTRRNHVLHRHRANRDTHLGRRGFEVHLFHQQFVERARSLGPAHSQLQKQLQRLSRVANRACGQHGVGDTEFSRNVHSQRDLVLRQDLLPVHFQHLPAEFNQLRANRSQRRPEGVQAGFETPRQMAVDVD